MASGRQAADLLVGRQLHQSVYCIQNSRTVNGWTAGLYPPDFRTEDLRAAPIFRPNISAIRAPAIPGSIDFLRSGHN